MKNVTPRSAGIVALLMIVSGALLSFTAKPGGEGFEIFVNNQLVTQQFGKDMDAVKTISLNNTVASGQLTVKYHHCGRAGKNRVIAIKDARNTVLKEWRYADTKDPYASMNCELKDINALQKNNGQLKLYYSSSELPSGRMLAALSTAASPKVVRVK